MRMASSVFSVTLALLFFSSCCALTHHDIIPLHMRGGRLFQSAVDEYNTFLTLNGFPQPHSSDALWFDQLINHSDPAAGSFRQRWWVDYSAYDGSGPAFLYINGEAPASGAIPGYALVVARSVGAVVFSMEHRYYGLSMPSNYTDHRTLKTLSVETALLDLRAFINFTELVTLGGRKMKWVTIGGSYAGALSAWFKQQFPDVAVAAWSSSGVVEAQFNYYGYEGHVMDVVSPICQDAVRTVMSIAEAMWDNETRRPALLQIFGAPSYFLKGDFFYMLADAVAGAVQYGHKSIFCDSILPQNMTDPLGQYNSAIVALFGTGFAGCYYSTVCLSSESMQSQWAGAGYAWIYQTCTQLAYWQVGFYNSLRPAMVVNTDYFENQCRLAFGQSALPDTFAFNDVFHGKDNQASNVIALQGSDDPWLTAGITTSLGPDYPAIIADCDDCGHCGDLSAPKAADPPSLTAQRAAVAKYIGGWLQTTEETFVITLRGDLSHVSEDDSLPAILEALQLDLQATVDRSARLLASGMTNTSIASLFQVSVTPFNSVNVSEGITALRASQNGSLLVRTDTAFALAGGTGALFVQSLVQKSPGAVGTDGTTGCEASCLVAIGSAVVALLVILSVVVIYRRRKGARLLDEQEAMNDKLTYGNVT